MNGRQRGRGQLIIDSDFDLVLIRFFFFIFLDGACDSLVCLATVLQISFGLIMR